jgi:hypothetical protein
MRKLIGTCVFLLGIAACGKSLYAPVSENTSAEAVREDAIVALDAGNYARASEKLAQLWAGDKSNSVAQLYGISLLGEGGFDLFSIMKNALALTSSGSASGGTDIMNQMVDNTTALFGRELTAQDQAYAKRAFDVLGAAQNPAEAGIHFQRCLTASIYSIPVLQSVAVLEAKLREIQTAVTNLGGTAAYCGAASSEAVALLGEGLNGVTASAGALAQDIGPVSEALESCLGGSGAQASKVISQIQGVVAKADKGCAFDVGVPLPLGGITTLPTCLNTYVSAGTTGAVAGDGQIAGCELLIHCSGGACF